MRRAAGRMPGSPPWSEICRRPQALSGSCRVSRSAISEASFALSAAPPRASFARSFRFLPACLRLPFAWPSLPSFSVLASSPAAPATSLAFPFSLSISPAIASSPFLETRCLRGGGGGTPSWRGRERRAGAERLHDREHAVQLERLAEDADDVRRSGLHRRAAQQHHRTGD